MPGKKNVIYHSKVMDKVRFEILLEKNSKSLPEVLELMNKAALRPNERFLLTENAIDVAFAAFECGWTLCQMQENPKSRSNSDRGKELADKIIKAAFK